MGKFSRAEKLLASRDPVLKKIIAVHGPCRIKAQPSQEYFDNLVNSIVSQQISVKAAETIYARLRQELGHRIIPRRLARLSDQQMRAAGISPQKNKYLRDLATRWLDGTIKHASLSSLPDEEVIRELALVKGIGRWTAEMFLMFSLGRMDVLPLDDLGLKKGVQKAYGLKKLPSERTLRHLAKLWQPYRSVATWYMWAILDNKT